MIVRGSILRRMHCEMLFIEKHRRVQLYVTALTLLGGFVYFIVPEYSHVAAIAGIITNLVWVWE